MSLAIASLDEALAGANDTAAAESNALALFQSVARDVPAYGAFLAQHHVDPDRIRTFEDFTRLPLVTKQNYVTRYPLRARYTRR